MELRIGGGTKSGGWPCLRIASSRQGEVGACVCLPCYLLEELGCGERVAQRMRSDRRDADRDDREGVSRAHTP